MYKEETNEADGQIAVLIESIARANESWRKDIMSDTGAHHQRSTGSQRKRNKRRRGSTSAGDGCDQRTAECDLFQIGWAFLTEVTDWRRDFNSWCQSCKRWFPIQTLNISSRKRALPSTDQPWEGQKCKAENSMSNEKTLSSIYEKVRTMHGSDAE